MHALFMPFKKKFSKLHFSVEFSMERLVNYGVNQNKKRTLIDDQKYEYNFEKIKNGTEFWRYQKFFVGMLYSLAYVPPEDIVKVIFNYSQT